MGCLPSCDRADASMAERWRCVVVMGASGSGKTTLAAGLAGTLGWTLADGDGFHPRTNIRKLSDGHPLTDEDRWPWLEAIAAWLTTQRSARANAVVSCSALRRTYRDLLRQDRPEVIFCFVEVSAHVLAERLAKRTNHFMSPTLLADQLATLEPLESDEPAFVVNGDRPQDEVLDQALRGLSAAERN
jgi:gluconokinase